MRLVTPRWHLLAAVAAVVAGTAGFARAAGEQVRQILPFDGQWRFSGMLAADLAGAEAPAFKDGEWRVLDLPHDWSIEGQPDPANRSGPAGAMLPTGFGWYRKTFTAPANAAGKRVFVEFDGVMQDSRVFLNGQDLGRRPYGYATFRYDLTGKLNATGDNVLAVHVDHSLQPSSRWYPGSGINRHVRLIVTNPVHVDQWATQITTSKADAKTATVHVETAVINHANVPATAGVQIELIGPDGKSAGQATLPPRQITPGDSEKFMQDITVSNPQLWGFESPKMYSAVVRVKADNATVDDDVTPFGIRTFEFKADTGFWLNGQNAKLYGVCLHHDGGGVGAAVPMGVWERRLTQLRQLGVNAVRTSHNAPDPAFLDLCDRMGFVVMHELFDVWTARKVPGDYARFFDEWWERDLTDAIRRDFNHPSIVIYSAGNEIHDSQEKQKEILQKLLAVYKKMDPSRPVTQALFRPENQGGAYTNGIAEMLDIVGTNYRPDRLSEYHKAHPQAKIIGTEDNYRIVELSVLRDDPALAGTFVWTGVDYLGEGRIAPSISQGFGMIDRTNEVRLRGYERQAWWTTTPMVKMGRAGPRAGSTNDVGGGHLLDWTPANTNAHDENVEVFSNCEEVELFLNDKSLGAKPMPKDVIRKWQVPFAAGTLKAVAKNGGKVVATDELKTAGAATAVKATVDQPKLSPAWDDVSYVKVDLVDAKGVTNPAATHKVTFKVEGPGVLMAVDNADLDSHEKFRGNERSAYRGKCLAVIKATGTSGKIRVTASAEGLEPATVEIDAVAAK
jgi:beta-galactosidase